MLSYNQGREGYAAAGEAAAVFAYGAHITMPPAITVHTVAPAALHRQYQCYFVFHSRTQQLLLQGLAAVRRLPAAGAWQGPARVMRPAGQAEVGRC
jgi:hypothetical protein